MARAKINECLPVYIGVVTPQHTEDVGSLTGTRMKINQRETVEKAWVFNSEEWIVLLRDPGGLVLRRFERFLGVL